MKATYFRCAAVAVVLVLAGRAKAQVLLKLGNLPYGNDNVQSYFSADADTTHITDPGTLPPWGPAGIGPYAGYSVPSVPPPPATPIYGSQLTPSNSFFGGPFTSHFTDGGAPPTTGTMIIDASPGGGSTVASANIHAGLKLVEPNPPLSYAYEQMDFVADYGAAGPLAGGIGGAPSLIVTGVTSGTGSYAELAGEVDYYWQSTNTAFTPNTSPWTNLGSLFYNFSTGGPGVFGPVLVAPTGSLSASPSGPGVLELIGDFYVAGDPAQIDVESTPEPSSWVLFAICMATVLVWSTRRRMANVAEGI